MNMMNLLCVPRDGETDLLIKPIYGIYGLDNILESEMFSAK